MSKGGGYNAYMYLHVRGGTRLILCKQPRIIVLLIIFFNQDLVEFSKEKGVNLHTHNDEREILPVDQLPLMFTSSPSTTKGQGFDHTHWSPAWVIKYSSIIRLRGIIAHKG